ncbi:MAG: SMC-Scp complex subunit ScpB, partial [Patescibacteria group bacterium]
ASLETLSLIAYLGPVPRASIDYIRGVNSSFTIRSLVMRGLVERGNEKGASFHYRITERFLKHMGLTSIEQMPEYAKYKETLKQYEEQLQQPAETPTIQIPSE